MYQYEWDKETGGILLLERDQGMFSKEPRPVYAPELDILGLSQVYNYDAQTQQPYMWAEANNYFYRGEKVFRTNGGTLYSAPRIEFFNDTENQPLLPKGTKLLPVNTAHMVEKNKDLLTILQQNTIRNIYNYYKRKKDKLDCFHVAFSGGKDSIVLLDLVERALPKTAFLVVFGDTGMEFPDTYQAVDMTEARCKEVGIPFYRAQSRFSPCESWEMFGPPSRALRWCCTVHKSAPQTLKIREILGKNNYVGADFVGVRKFESETRSKYSEESYGQKQKGQYSYNPILDWSSAEIWLYIYAFHLPVNASYKKGNSRAGCLFCPMGGGKGDFFQNQSYPEEVGRYIDIIKKLNSRDKGNPAALDSYVENGGWNARKNGRDLVNGQQKYVEKTTANEIKITVRDPRTPWQEWMKTMGDFPVSYTVQPTKDGYEVTAKAGDFATAPSMRRRFKQVFKKSAYCIGCNACETNCVHHCISFKEGLSITDCLHCGACHDIPDGCLVCRSLSIPTGGQEKMKTINSFANHAPKMTWIKDFFEQGDDFWLPENLSLGKNQIPLFKKFLRACNLIDQKTSAVTPLFSFCKTQGLESKATWGILLTNFSYNSQCRWYIKTLEIDRTYQRELVLQLVEETGLKRNDATSVLNAFKRLSEIPFGTILHTFVTQLNGSQISSIRRSPAEVNDPRIILYALYRFAKESDVDQFSLARLLDPQTEDPGMSPVEIFGLSRTSMEQFLNALNAKYPDYITASFTHGLDKVSLNADKTADDILSLWEGWV